MPLPGGQSARQSPHPDLEGDRQRGRPLPPDEFGAPPQGPTGWLKLLFEFPAHLFRLGLGGFFGGRLLLLTHRGRSSGRPYRTVLEVMRFVPETEEYLVASAFGEGADWFRNIRANPALEVQVDSRRFVPILRFLSPEEGYEELADYERRHPLAARMLLRLVGIRFDGSDEQLRWLAAVTPVVGLRPET